MPTIIGHDLFDNKKNGTNIYHHTESVKREYEPIEYEHFYGVGFFAVLMVLINIIVMISVIKAHRKEISGICQDITEWLFLVLCVKFQRQEITDGFETCRRENSVESVQGEVYDNHAYLEDCESTYESTFEEIDLNEGVDIGVKTKSSSLERSFKPDDKLTHSPKVCSISSKVSKFVNIGKFKCEDIGLASKQRNCNNQDGNNDFKSLGKREFTLHM